ncbi:MAG TPA: phosphoadenylyl-sulfate reductase, partial [Asanoa sp.]|nr:phosphoadenylyl-sulfate reductase [Asanoa sp.]
MSAVNAVDLGLVSLGGSRPAELSYDTADRRSADELKALADAAGRDLEGAPALEIARWASTTFGPRFCVTSSM